MPRVALYAKTENNITSVRFVGADRLINTNRNVSRIKSKRPCWVATSKTP